MILKKKHTTPSLLWFFALAFFWLLQICFFSFSWHVFVAPHLWDAGSLQPKTCKNWPGKTVDFSAFTPMFWGSCFLRKKVHPHVPPCFGSGKICRKKSCFLRSSSMSFQRKWDEYLRSFTYHMKGADTNSQNCWKSYQFQHVLPFAVELQCPDLGKKHITSDTRASFLGCPPLRKTRLTIHQYVSLNSLTPRFPKKKWMGVTVWRMCLFKSWEFIPIGMSFQWLRQVASSSMAFKNMLWN